MVVDRAGCGKVERDFLNQHRRQTTISRRHMLSLSLAVTLWPAALLAGKVRANTLAWHAFVSHMKQLAAEYGNGITGSDVVAARGQHYLQRLNTASAEFESAVDESYETGNRFWTWQRMLKQENINGGVLTVDHEQHVQLHDHPGATGILRILSGKLEIWQFDRHASTTSSDGDEIAELTRVSHRVLGPGDTAVLTPGSGNIHALRAVSTDCSMLDVFIPPYNRSERSWYEPLDNDWENRETLACRCIPQHEFAMT